MDPRETSSQIYYLKRLFTSGLEVLAEIEGRLTNQSAPAAAAVPAPQKSGRGRPRAQKPASIRVPIGSTIPIATLDDSREYTVNEAAEFFQGKNGKKLKPGTIRGHLHEGLLEKAPREDGKVRIRGAEIRRRLIVMGLDG